MTWSLRARLVVGLVGLVLAGLLVADVSTYVVLQRILDQRVDTQLIDGMRSLNAESRGEPGRAGPGPGEPHLAWGTYEAIALDDGTIVSPPKAPPPPFDQTVSAPVLPTPLSGVKPDCPITVAGTGYVDHYRLLVHPLPGTDGYAVLAIPLTDVNDTLFWVSVLEASIGAAALAGMAIFALVVVRLGLRPLRRMALTAEAIAGGDLSQRVSPATSKTEIGRLGLALNSMLSQIESAFEERTRSEQRLRRFIADASHELRTPLTSIRGYAELLRRGAQRSPADAELARRRIEEEATRMGVLVDDMLLLARLDQGRPLERAPVDLRAIVRDARADASAVAPDRSVTVEAPAPVVVTGDDMRLRQVVGNLVRNALAYTPAGTPIEIGLGRQDGHAVLTVADHGPGLPAGVGERIFERFYRGDAGRSRDQGGAGLGLSIVAAVVAAHEGVVRVSRTSGGGATFAVELPLAG